MKPVLTTVPILPDVPPAEIIRAAMAALGSDCPSIQARCVGSTGRFFNRHALLYMWNAGDTLPNLNGMLVILEGAKSGYLMHGFRKKDSALLLLMLGLSDAIDASMPPPEPLEPGGAFERLVALAADLEGRVGPELAGGVYAHGDDVLVADEALVMIRPLEGRFRVEVHPSIQARDRMSDIDHDEARALFDEVIAPGLQALGFDCDAHTPWLSTTPAEYVVACTREAADPAEVAALLRALRGCIRVVECGVDPDDV